MSFKSVRAVITGGGITLLLLVVLASSRLWKMKLADKEVEVVELVELTILEPAPEEPPLDESEELLEEEIVEDLTPPVPESELLEIEALEAPELPLTTVKFNPTVKVDIMAIDRAPAVLPKKPVYKPKPKPVYKPKPKYTSKTSSSKSKYTPKSTYTPKAKPKYTPKAKPKTTYQPKPKPKPPAPKPYYSTGELDGTPRQIRQGSFSWPSRAKGTSGTVVLTVELSTSGRVSVISVNSTTDSALTEAAKRIAKGSRYTSPTKNGQKVKARFRKTYKLVKPR